MNKLKLSILAIADIHIELLIQNELVNMANYMKYFKDTLYKYKPDIFCIPGDFIHKSTIQAESNEYYYATKFLETLANVCRELGIIFIIIRGTLSHDGDVVTNMIKLNRDGFSRDIKYYDEMCIEEINGYSFLMLPEVTYPTLDDFNNDLNKILNGNKVDIVLFHNMFDFAIPFLKQINSEYNLGRSVVINTIEFAKIFNIVAIGGHVHDDISNSNVYYTGQFINQRGKISKDKSHYGLKLFTIENGRHTYQNIINPYYIENKICNLDFSQVDLDTAIHISKEYDVADTIFILKNLKRAESTFSDFKRAIKPRYFKAIYIEEVKESNLPDNYTINLSTSQDVLSLLKEIYLTKHNNTLPNYIVESLTKEE